MLQETGHIKNTVVLIFRPIQCLHLMYYDVAWALVSSGTQAQLQIILYRDYLSDYLSFSSQPAWDVSERSYSVLHWERHHRDLLETSQKRWLFLDIFKTSPIHLKKDGFFCDVFKTYQKYLKKNAFCVTSWRRFNHISKKCLFVTSPRRLKNISGKCL